MEARLLFELNQLWAFSILRHKVNTEEESPTSLFIFCRYWNQALLLPAKYFLNIHFCKRREHVIEIKDADLSRTHAFKTLPRYNLSLHLAHFAARPHPCFSGNSTQSNAVVGVLSHDVLTSLSQEADRRSKQNQTLSFWNQVLSRDKKMRRAGVFVQPVGLWEGTCSLIPRATLYHSF